MAEGENIKRDNYERTVLFAAIKVKATMHLYDLHLLMRHEPNDSLGKITGARSEGLRQ